MGWREVDEKSKQGLDKHVDCDDGDAIRIKHAILQEFPNIEAADIDKAIEACCDELPVPRLRNAFLSCLQQKLG